MISLEILNSSVQKILCENVFIYMNPIIFYLDIYIQDTPVLSFFAFSSSVFSMNIYNIEYFYDTVNNKGRGHYKTAVFQYILN